MKLAIITTGIGGLMLMATGVAFLAVSQWWGQIVAGLGIGYIGAASVVVAVLEWVYQRKNGNL